MTSTEFRQGCDDLLTKTQCLIDNDASPKVIQISISVLQAAALVEIAAQLMDLNERK